MIATRGRILVVDDRATNLKLAQVLLDAEGFEVRTAVDAIEALEIIAAEHPDLVLTDIQLPGMDGFELARRLKADPATAGIVVVGLSAYAGPGDEARARRAGCDGYIAKPVNTRTLADDIDTYLNTGKP